MGMLSSLQVPFRLLGGAALCWSVIALPIFFAAAPAREFVERIMADRSFRPAVMAEVLAEMKPEHSRTVLKASLLRAKAFAVLRTADKNLNLAEKGALDGGASEGSIRTSLSLNPADSFLWLMLYSTRVMDYGFSGDILKYMQQSYGTGPREGWIALKRNRLALAAFLSLDEGAREMAVEEFADLVESDLTEYAVSNLIGVGWTQRERLLSSLDRVDLVSKQRLKKLLLNEGYKLVIPGVEYDERPWR